MYILKNAYLNIVRSKGRNVLIGLIILAVTLGACIAITINKSGNNLVKSYKDTNPLEASLNLDVMSYRNATDDEKESFKLLDVDTIKKIGNLEMVTGYYYTLQSSLNSDDITPVSYDNLFNKDSTGENASNEEKDNQRPNENRNFMSTADYSIVAYSDVSYDEDFVSGNKKIIDGKMIGKENTEDSIVISEELAKQNNLSVGDTINFKNSKDDTKTYSLKVSGIYSVTDTATNNEPGRAQRNSSNQIYTNITVLNKVMADDGTDTTSYAMFSSISSKFYVKYENIDSFTEGVKNLGISDFYKINTNEHEITSSLEPIKSISNFSLTFLFVILIVGAVVLTIINLFNIRERKYEIGVLRAIGMSKIKVTMQLVSEIFAVALVTLIIGTSVGTALAQPVSNYMLSSEIKSYQNKQDDIRKNFGGQGFARSGFSGNSSESRTNYRNNNTNSNTESYVTSLKVHTDFTTIIELFGVSLILTIISGVTAVTFVNKYEPNRILQNRG